jgi:hypothetical protein
MTNVQQPEKISLARKRAPRGSIICPCCKTVYIPNHQKICRACEAEKLMRLEQKYIEHVSIVVPSAEYPGEGCGFSWDEWFRATWKALRGAADKQWFPKSRGAR